MRLQLSPIPPLATAALLLTLLAAPARAGGAGSAPGQDASRGAPDVAALRKVRALHALSLHCEWPLYRFRDPESPLVVGILGDPALARLARDYLLERRARRRPIQVVSFRDGAQLGTCHLLFVGDCGGEDYQRAQAFARGRQVLLVAEHDAVARPEPSVALCEKPGRIAVEVDREQCKRAGIKPSPQLLALSRSHAADEER